MQAPVVVMSECIYFLNQTSLRVLIQKPDTNAGDRQVGRKAQLSNIAAAKTYANSPAFRIIVLLTHQPLNAVSRISFDHAWVPRRC